MKPCRGRPAFVEFVDDVENGGIPMASLQHLISFLVDKPLSVDERGYLVNREEEIEILSRIGMYQPYGVYGVAGETGIGKTTALNFVSPKDVFVKRVNITLKESVDSVLYDLTYSLAKSLEDEEDIAEEARKTREWIVEEVSSVKGFALGISIIATANVNIQKNELPRFNFFAARERLARLIERTIEVKGKFVLIIDELDKERKEDVLRILDAIKIQISRDQLVVILSLPYSIYREYSAERMRWNESGNLENIFKDVVFLEPLEKSEIEEMLVRRVHQHLHLIAEEVFEIASEFSDGNPRDAIWIMNKSIFENATREKLEGEHIIRTINRLVREYLGEQFSMTENQRKALKSLRNFSGSRNEIVEKLQKEGIKRTTAYSLIEQLIQKKILIKRNGILRMSGKFKYVAIE